MQQRKEEILAKKARLVELKRQRELRRDELSKSIHDGSELTSPIASRVGTRKDLDSLISSLVGETRPSSGGRRDSSLGLSGTRGSRPSSILSAEGSDVFASPGRAWTGQGHGARPTSPPAAPLMLSTAPLSVVYEFAPAPVVTEVLTYSKGVQTSGPWPSSSGHRASASDGGDSDLDTSPAKSRAKRNSKRLSRREKGAEEELRANLRREIEEELKAVQHPEHGGPSDLAARPPGWRPNFPGRPLTEEELNAVVSSDDFLGFVDRSTKVIERALDEEYDVLADYALAAGAGADEEEADYKGIRRKEHNELREVAQFWDERWSQRRMVTSLAFSPKFPELLLSSHTKNLAAPHEPDGVIQVWNLHLHDRPEYVFHAQSDILVAKFSPFHPHLIIGGAYSGQVLLWDLRAKSGPVQRTPMTGAGHSHPVYGLEVVGTQNANNIISCSTDGVVCGWTVDMLAQPQDFLELATPPPAKADDLAPTCMAFPAADPTYFVVGTEEGGLYACHRYDRAGAKAGVDPRISYRGHAAPVTSVHYHPARGPIDLGDLVLSSSLDWTVKLWRVRAPAPLSTGAGPGAGVPMAQPLLAMARDDVVYDVAWSPVKPAVFGLVDGAGHLEVWDLTVSAEVPVAQAQPSHRRAGPLAAHSLNKVVWEEHDGKKVAVGGLAGTVTVFDVGTALGGLDAARSEEWSTMKKLTARWDAVNNSHSNNNNNNNNHNHNTTPAPTAAGPAAASSRP
ncbi:MAG: hypothetical protein M1826_006845 [Phylliscum demangeonii]|nr:MAG: hypothetical protein M1826_006845 [Phylliscum demangeonii]